MAYAIALEPSEQVHVIDSHTGGEPTRVVVSGGPPLGEGSLRERLIRFEREFDHFRSGVVNEPRGSDPLVGALLSSPRETSCAAGVIFFNNVGYLGMCGHGTIGLVVTLAHLGRIQSGMHFLETPVGRVRVQLHDNGEVTFWNVPSYRLAADVRLEVPGCGTISGDVAWGGNWFFLTEECPSEITLAKVDALTEYAWQIRKALEARGITGADGALIDHIEISGKSLAADVHSRNFVLCPGKAYDRSPCGTGTSAKLACLHADGKLQPGEIWRQESITGSIFEGSIAVHDGSIIPQIRGAAFVTAEITLILEPSDPLRWGIQTGSRTVPKVFAGP